MEPSSSPVIEHVTTLAFDATVDRVVEVIAEAGLILFARIDHAQGARDVGLSMPPTIVLIYGHPKGGTPAMLAAPLAALDLPLHVLIRQLPDGRTALAFRPIDDVLRRAGVPDALAERIIPAQQRVLAALTS